MLHDLHQCDSAGRVPTAANGCDTCVKLREEDSSALPDTENAPSRLQCNPRSIASTPSILESFRQISNGSAGVWQGYMFVPLVPPPHFVAVAPFNGFCRHFCLVQRCSCRLHSTAISRTMLCLVLHREWRVTHLLHPRSMTLSARK